MPQSVDWPRIGRSQPRRRPFVLIVVVLAVIFFGGRTALSYYVDVLWFRSLGYGDVFWKTAESSLGNLHGICSGHISHFVRIVSVSEASTRARVAGRSHDHYWWTTG